MANEIIKYSIILYILTIFVIYISKPKMLYDEEKKKFKEFGFEEDKTFFCLPIVSIILAISIYLLMTFIAPEKENKKYRIKIKKRKPIIINYSDISYED